MITLRLANAKDAEVLKYWDTRPMLWIAILMMLGTGTVN